MSKIVRIWLYKTVEVFPHPECMPSETNRPVVVCTRGEFRYYRLDAGNVIRSSRKEARALLGKVGHQVETLMGYPDWMYDKGFRV